MNICIDIPACMMRPARGRGVGRALYTEVDRQMAAIDGADHLALEVNVDPPNEGSLRFHAGLGFVEVLLAVKQAEHEAYQNVISPWEREHLLLNV